jgi:micrococcal nuclease
VMTSPDNRALAKPMLAREAEAREAGRGIWASRAFALRKPEEARRHVESFEIVEGRVSAVGHLAGRSTLLLGTDARDGLTIALLPESRRLFREAGLDAQSLDGRRLRVRGWIRWWNGPLIEVSHPEQIEVLAP